MPTICPAPIQLGRAVVHRVASTVWKAPCFSRRAQKRGGGAIDPGASSHLIRWPANATTPGGISETTVDAEQNETSSEEDKVPVSSLYRPCIHHVPELSFGVGRLGGLSSPVAKDHHVKMQKDTTKLREWARQKMGLREVPSLNRLWPVSTRLVNLVKKRT